MIADDIAAASTGSDSKPSGARGNRKAAYIFIGMLTLVSVVAIILGLCVDWRGGDYSAANAVPQSMQRDTVQTEQVHAQTEQAMAQRQVSAGAMAASQPAVRSQDQKPTSEPILSTEDVMSRDVHKSVQRVLRKLFPDDAERASAGEDVALVVAMASEIQMARGVVASLHKQNLDVVTHVANEAVMQGNWLHLSRKPAPGVRAYVATVHFNNKNHHIWIPVVLFPELAQIEERTVVALDSLQRALIQHQQQYLQRKKK